MRFASLGSGSRGNATLIESGGTRLLLDCGFPAREAERRLGDLGVDPQTLDAILVTHEHGDHVRGVGVMARRHELPVWMTPGTFRKAACGDIVDLMAFGAHEGELQIGDFTVRPFAVPHDAGEPVQFVFEAGGCRLGILTDTGSITPHVVESLGCCDALVLECNHDSGMLASGPYPRALQARVGGALGHLSNRQAAWLVGHLDTPRLRHLVAAHLSEKNNRPELARSALLGSAPDLEDRLCVLVQDHAGPWLEL
jgi:phosphoribosyl 1,2-cyclic phosphodiesterase